MGSKQKYRNFHTVSYDKTVDGEIRTLNGKFVLAISCDGMERVIDLFAINEQNSEHVVFFAEKIFNLYASKAALGQLWVEEEKPNVRLFHWYIDCSESHGRTWWYTSGITLGHPKILDSQHMSHSSEIMDICIDEEQKEVCITTRNTIFHCPLDECDYSKESTYTYLPELIRFRSEYEPDQNRFDMENNSVLLVFSDRDYYYYRYGALMQDGIRLKFRMSTHIGMFQDSVLVFPEDREVSGMVDIRYFPHPGHIAFYDLDIPDGCKLYVENQGDRDFYIDIGNTKLQLHPGERKLYNVDNAMPPNESPVMMDGDLYPAGVILPTDEEVN